VKKIGKEAFVECKNLTTIKVPKDCEIGENAFPSTTEVIKY